MSKATSKTVFLTAFLLVLGILIPAGWAHEGCEKEKSAQKGAQSCKMMPCPEHKSSCADKEDDQSNATCPKIMFFKKIGMILSKEDALSLSDEQLAALKSLKLKTQKDLILKGAEIEVNDLDIRAQMWDENWDADALNSLIDTKFDLSKEEAKILVSAFVVLRATLTQEQSVILNKLCGKTGKSHGMCPISKSPAASEEKATSEASEMKTESDMMEHSSDTMNSSSEEKESYPVTGIPSPMEVKEEKHDASTDDFHAVDSMSNMEMMNSTQY